MTDRLLVSAALTSAIGVTLGTALMWPPLAIVVGSLALSGIMVGAAVLIALRNTRGPEA